MSRPYSDIAIPFDDLISSLFFTLQEVIIAENLLQENSEWVAHGDQHSDLCLQYACLLSGLDTLKCDVQKQLTVTIENRARHCDRNECSFISGREHACMQDAVSTLQERARSVSRELQRVPLVKPSCAGGNGGREQKTSLSFRKGRWVHTLDGGELEDPRSLRTTSLGRLKRNYDKQCLNILELEKERNELQLKLLSVQANSNTGSVDKSR